MERVLGVGARPPRWNGRLTPRVARASKVTTPNHPLSKVFRMGEEGCLILLNLWLEEQIMEQLLRDCGFVLE